MYKNRHSGGKKNTRGQGVVAVLRGSLHFNAFSTYQHYSQNRNLGLSNVAATLFHQTPQKLSLLQPCERNAEWYQLYHHDYTQGLLTPTPRCSPTQCVTVCVSERHVPWQRGQSGPFKSPWAAGESPRDDSTGQNNIKKRQQQKSNTMHSTRISPISQTMSYVHLKQTSFCFIFSLRSILKVWSTKIDFSCFLSMYSFLFLLWEK